MGIRSFRCEKNFRLKGCRAKCLMSPSRRLHRWKAAHSSPDRALPTQKIESPARARRNYKSRIFAGHRTFMPVGFALKSKTFHETDIPVSEAGKINRGFQSPTLARAVPTV